MNDKSEERLKEIILSLKTGIKALKAGTEFLERGLKNLEENVLNKETLEKLQKIISGEAKPAEKRPEEVEIKIKKIKSEPEVEKGLSEIDLEEIYPIPEGVDAGTFLTKRLARKVASETAIHSAYAKYLAENFYKVVKEEVPFEIKTKGKLKLLAYFLGISPELQEKEILNKLSEKVFQLFSEQNEEQPLIQRAPQPLIEKWKKYKVIPAGIDKEILKLICSSSEEGDQYYKNILFNIIRCSLANGWGSLMLAAELKDILFGIPQPLVSNTGSDLIKEEMINVLVCGINPFLNEALKRAAKEKEIVDLSKKVGANGVNLISLCGEVEGSFADREMLLENGAIEAVVIDSFCTNLEIIKKLSKFHTVVITTNPNFMMEGAIHVEFNVNFPLESAKEILKIAISRYSKRERSKVFRSSAKKEIITGFGLETLMYAMGGRFRASLAPLNENIGNGKVLGLVLLLGDNSVENSRYSEVLKELIANNILVLAVGCKIKNFAEFLSPESSQFAGEGLREFLEATGLPPVLHMGACVESARILALLTEMVNTGGLGKDISELPVAGFNFRKDVEKISSIDVCFSASGIQTVFESSAFKIKSQKVTNFLSKEMEEYFGGGFKIVREEKELVNAIIDRIKTKRKELGIDEPKPRILYDMAMRRTLEEKRYIPLIHRFGIFREFNERGN